MKGNSQPSSNEFYSGLANSLKQKFVKQFNQYNRIYLQKKIRCYEKGANGSPASPEEYYICIEQAQMEMKTNSDKLGQHFNRLEVEDRQCQTICRKSFDTGDKLNDCIKKCFNKYSDSAHTIYKRYYEDVFKSQ